MISISKKQKKKKKKKKKGCRILLLPFITLSSAIIFTLVSSVFKIKPPREKTGNVRFYAFIKRIKKTVSLGFTWVGYL